MTPAIYERYRESVPLNLRVAYRDARRQVAPGETYVQHFMLFVGPRQGEVLATYGALRFSDVNDYGIFGLVNLFIYLLEKLKTLAFGNWGLAIILLTVIVKLCLHPVNKKSQRSIQRGQKKMQKVKPQMDALKEKYKDNRMKLNQELQKVFREHDVNPAQQLGGCLVIFLQLPIWFALYSTLRYAIGLRQENFLYILDLTRPDHLFPLGVQLPILGSYFNLLPVLYVILTLVNQQLQPKPDDPQMQAQFRMMSFMMVFFGFIFYAFPSGFMLYIMTSSALGIIEIKIIKAELAREDMQQGPDGVAVAAGPSGGAPYRASGKLEGKSARQKGKAKGKGKRS
jgi:YidC/Oxa1 family membrane protein insertase